PPASPCRCPMSRRSFRDVASACPFMSLQTRCVYYCAYNIASTKCSTWNTSLLSRGGCPHVARSNGKSRGQECPRHTIEIKVKSRGRGRPRPRGRRQIPFDCAQGRALGRKGPSE